MAVTRIKNNQITDATVVASAKLVDYSITAAKIANNLTYGSDLTITGNLTVNGQTTTIDTVSTVIEDPVIVLASNQTGSPSVDIGFIGERGTSNNIAFVWDESASEFVTVFTTDLVTNTTVSISSYADFHTNNANVGGNLTVGGNVSFTGNVTSLNVTGNITGGNLLTPGVVTATGNVTGGNLVTAGEVAATGNVTGSNINLSGNIVDSNALSIITGSGNVSLSPGGTTTVVATTAGASITGTLDTTGNITGSNLNTAGQVVATGNVTGGNVNTAGQVNASTTITATGNITGGNLTTAGLTQTNTLNVTAGANVGTTLGVTGNITGGNLTTAGITSTGSLTASTTIDATGNITGGNVSAGSGTISTTGNINGGNLNATTGVTSTTVTATGNVTGGNLITTGVTQTGTLETTGNALVGGNLIVQGNITYINIDDLRVEDPIIILGTGPNGAPLTVDDGMDRGVFMEYYKTGLGNAFMGWDNSSGNMVIAASASFASNNVVTYNAYGTLEAGNLYIQSAVSTGNVTAGNLITSGALAVTGNVSGGNLTTAGQVVATGNVTGGNLITTGNVDSNGGYFTGNVTVLGTLTSTSNIVANVSGIFYGNTITGNEALYAGVPGYTFLGSDIVVQTTGNVNNYSQINFQNINNGTRSSTDFVLTADNGDDSSNFVNLGITGSNWDGTQLNSLGNALRPNDAYLYADTGNIIIGTTVPNDHLRVIVGGSDNNYIVAEFHDLNTESTSTSTGTLTVTGGIGALGNIYGANLYTPGLVSATGNVTGGNLNTAGQVVATGNVNGGNVVAVALVSGANVSATANVTGANVVGTTSGTFGNIIITGSNIDSTAGRITINQADADVDFAVDGDTLANIFYVDAGTGTASFGNSTQTTGALVAFNDTTSILMPVGTTVERPSGVLGMLRFNSVDDNLEVYSGAGWEAVGVPVFTVISDEQFNGDGSTVAFTLGSSQTTASCIVSINGVVQLPTVAYSVSGTTLTFTEAPQSGDVIDVRQITTTTTITAISNTPGTAIIQPDATLAKINITGNLIPSANITYDLGSNTSRWNDLYLSGNTITLGNTVIKNTGGNTIGFFGPDGTTPATIDAASVDTTTIANGTSSVSVVASGGNIRANVGGNQIAVITNSGVQITGDLSVSGNATLTGNILGDRIQNGTTQIDIQTQNGNANITVGGTSNVAVFSTQGVNIAGNASVTSNVIVGTGSNIGQMYMFGGNIHFDNPTEAANITMRCNVPGQGVIEVFKVLGLGGARVDGQFGATGNITTTANISGGNVISNAIVASSTVTATGNITGGNLNTAGQVVATGNITGGNVSAGSGTISVGQLIMSGNTIQSTQANLIIDPSGGGAATGTLFIAGNLDVQGAITVIESTTLTTNELVLQIANNAATASAANGAGISVGPFGSGYASITYNSVGNIWTVSNGANVSGALNATANITGANIVTTGTVSTPSITKTGSNAVGNIGSSTNYFNTVFATATSALYADLAEKYTADAEYAPGTVVCFGGTQEVTVTSADADSKVAGVISTNPSYIMNSGLEAEHVATIALTGRVPCRVTGTVRKGDLMVSAGYGLARAEANPRAGTIIGKALADFDGQEGVIEVVVGRF